MPNVDFTIMENLIAIFTDPAAWLALLTLTVMEVVLGIDNLLFISVLSNKLPEHNRSFARRVGIAGALVLRLVFLATIVWIVKLTTPVFEVFGKGFSWRDLILIAGGLFLLWKATSEIHHTVDPEPGPDRLNPKVATTSVTLRLSCVGFKTSYCTVLYFLGGSFFLVFFFCTINKDIFLKNNKSYTPQQWICWKDYL